MSVERIYVKFELQKKINMALELNDSIFEEKVLKSDKPVLVDFWARP